MTKDKKVTKKTNNFIDHGFVIDFIELSFLVEACIPPRPIARSMFWDRLINEIYFKLTEDERSRLFVWIQRNPSFNLKNEDCQLFYHRFDPENQYTVHCLLKGKKSTIECFKMDDTYWTAKNVSIVKEYIEKIEKKS